MPAVSIVIPLYNAENYFAQTLDSIVNQTFTDWELIIIDDCSTDGSYAMAAQAVEKDSRIKLLKTPANTGSAKVPYDIGIKAATTDWVTAIGCDDFFDLDTIGKLVERQRETSADIVYLRMDFFNDETGDLFETTPKVGFDYSQVISGKEAMMMTVGKWLIGANGALIKRDIVNRRSTFDNDAICYMNADEYDNREMLSMAQRVAFADTGYKYRIRSSSICRKISPKLFETIISDRMVAELVEREFGADSPEHRKAKTVAIGALLAKYIQWVKFAKQLTPEGRKYACKLMQTERARYSCAEICHSELSFTKKILLVIPRWMALIPIKAYVALKQRTK